MREEGRGVNLGLSLFQTTEELAAAILVVAQESAVVKQICTGRNSLIHNIAPCLCRHFLLHDIKLGAESRNSLAVIPLLNPNIPANQLCIASAYGRRCVNGRNPLCQQRNAFTAVHIGDVFLQLCAHNVQQITLQISTEEAPEIIPAAILRHKLNQGLDVIGIALRHVLEHDAEQAALTKTAPDIAGKEQPLHSGNLILKESPCESRGDITRGCLAKRSNGEIQIKQALAGGAISNRTILRKRNIVLVVQSLLHSGHKIVAHRCFLLKLIN